MKYINTLIAILAITFNLSAQCIDDTHSPFQNQGWMSCNKSVGPIPERGDVHWLQYDLGAVYVLDSLYVWNHNVWGETEMGVKSVMIDYSTDQQNWISAGPFTIEKAPGSWKYQGVMGPSLNNAQAKYVVISILSTYNEDAACAGVGEFLFYLGESVDVDDIELVEADWNISPNPTTEYITITLPQSVDLVSLSLFNSVGSKISDLPLPAVDQITVPVSDLQNGLYYINYQSKKETKSKSFVLH
jgi:hypothetical protein